MGQSLSREYLLPSGRTYSISYCKQLKIKDFCPTKSIDLSNLLPFDNCIIITPKEHGILKLIYSAINYKITNLGYSLKIDYRQNITFKEPLNECLDKIKVSDIIIKKQCYRNKLNTIKSLLSTGNILVAGIIIDQIFIDKCLNIDEKIDKTLSDIIIIIGFNLDSLIIKTNWVAENIKINFKFIDNITEVWNFEIESPEERFLNENLNENLN